MYNIHIHYTYINVCNLSKQGRQSISSCVISFNTLFVSPVLTLPRQMQVCCWRRKYQMGVLLPPCIDPDESTKPLGHSGAQAVSAVVEETHQLRTKRLFTDTAVLYISPFAFFSNSSRCRYFEVRKYEKREIRYSSSS